MDPKGGTLSVLRESRRRRRVVLTIDGEPVRTTSLDVVRTLGLADGDTYTAAELAASIQQTEPSCALERALRLVGYRDRSVEQLRSRLLDDGFSVATTAHTIERLQDLEYLDDVRFAAAYARSKTRSGWGQRRITAGLIHAGVSDDVIEEALELECPRTAQRQRAAAQVRPSDLTDRKTRERAMRRLVSRGFTWDEARAAVSANPEIDDDDPDSCE